MDVSILIVHFGNPKITKKCLKSVYKSDLKGINYEILILDNTPGKDHTSNFKKYKNLRYIITNKNNYAYALNLGTKESKGEFIVFLNPDIKADKNWLKELINSARKNNKIGGVMSKILFSKTKKINSMGIQDAEDYYYKDINIHKEDNKKDTKGKKIKAASGCCVLYRREALEDVNGLDEDFIMYYEDVDLGFRLNDKGWKIIINPKSIIYHDLHGTTGDENKIPCFFCNRNRFLFIAKRKPDDFAKQIPKSYPYIHKQFDVLFKYIKFGVIELFKTQNEAVIKRVYPKIMLELSKIYPLDKIQNLTNEIELFCNLRRPRICLYDRAMHFIGGGQKYGLTIAEAIKKTGDITLVSNKPVTISQLENWYDLKLKGCKLKIIELPIYKEDTEINPSLAIGAARNPFEKIEDEVLNYDLFINVNMVPSVNALALKNIFLCHFPDTDRSHYFYPSKYDFLISNSKYTDEWIKKKWGLKSNLMIYPPIDMKYKGKVIKENIILSVSRFEVKGSKKQLEMAKIFCSLYKKNPKILKGWKLVLCGGTFKKNAYLAQVKNYIKSCGCPIKVVTNLSNEDLKKLYAKSKIFWHACGLNENLGKNPVLIEHFGMTTVEAMQNGCVPVVFDGGGQKEIVENRVNGFRFRNERDMKRLTIRLIKEKITIKHLSLSAKKSSNKYSKEKFQKTYKKLIETIISGFREKKNHVPEVQDVISSLNS
ncbi:glycosyltransferase [Candidatus Peregrinibacteria bacterium]|nr:glycosyltransferase [Candidatus Peregrinibacteria bacterium]